MTAAVAVSGKEKTPCKTAAYAEMSSRFSVSMNFSAAGDR
jgi:hypothetical protein